MDTLAIKDLREREYWLQRTSAANRRAEVVVTYPPSGPRNRHSHYMLVSGQREAVMDHVAYTIQTDHYDYMYSQLSWSVVGVQEEGESVAIKLYRSSYAGD